MTIKDIREAHERIIPYIRNTPLLNSGKIDELVGKNVWFKCENLQIGGSFKLRGASNRLLKMGAEQRSKGVVAYSSGNHGKALALIGKRLGVSVTLVLSKDTSSQKIDAARDLGANIVEYDPAKEDRVLITEDISKRTGAIIVPPYENELIIAGQGTAVYEALIDLEQKNVSIDGVLAPVGGGGLLAGSSISAKGLRESIKVYGVEPKTGNDLELSLKAGHIVRISDPETIAEGLRTNSPGEVPFPYLQKNVDKVYTVEDGSIRKAMKLIWDELKLVVEPAGAITLAALTEHPADINEKDVLLVISGGNISFEDYKKALLTNT